MQTNFYGMTETQAVSHALIEFMGFARVEKAGVFVIEEDAAGVITLKIDEAKTFRDAACALGKNFFNREILPARRRRFYDFSQMLIELEARFQEDQAMVAARAK